MKETTLKPSPLLTGYSSSARIFVFHTVAYHGFITRLSAKHTLRSACIILDNIHEPQKHLLIETWRVILADLSWPFDILVQSV